MAAYAGTYRGDDASELKVALDEGKLRVQFAAGPAAQLTAIDQVSFQAGDGALTFTFRREGDKVTGLTWKRDTTETIFRRIEPSKEPAQAIATIEDRAASSRRH